MRESELIALVGGTIIDGNGGTPIEDGVVVIENGRIAAVAGHSSKVPPGAKVVSVAGKFIIPGLIDALVYLVGDYEPANTFIRYEDQFEELAIEGAQVALANGVTTLFAGWGPRDDLIKARDAINQSRVPGARIYVAGNIIGYGGPYSDDFGLGGVKDLNHVISHQFTDRVNARFTHNVGAELTLMSLEQIRQEVRRYVRSGIDFVNIAATSHHFGSGRYFVFSPRVLRAIVEEAHAAGLLVMSYKIDNAEALAMQLEAGSDLLAQCEIASGSQPFSDEMVALFVRQRIPCLISGLSETTIDFLRPKLGSFAKVLKTGDINARALINAGALTVMMTQSSVFGPETLHSSRWDQLVTADGDQPRVLGEGHFRWLINVLEKGMKPMAALMSATSNAAKAFKIDQELGSLEKGKIADLLVLDRSPLEDGENYRRISLIMKEGRVIDRNGLPCKKLLTSPTHSSFKDSATSFPRASSESRRTVDPERYLDSKHQQSTAERL